MDRINLCHKDTTICWFLFSHSFAYRVVDLADSELDILYVRFICALRNHKDNLNCSVAYGLVAAA